MNLLRDFFKKIDQGDSQVFILGIVFCIVGMLLFSAKVTIKISGSSEGSPGKNLPSPSFGSGFSIVRSSLLQIAAKAARAGGPAWFFPHTPRANGNPPRKPLPERKPRFPTAQT